ncbi:MAG: hypothetical protein J6A04_02865 [Clostridia bacterium]|nr:hypothetical protein [Clostridia bacterium]
MSERKQLRKHDVSKAAEDMATTIITELEHKMRVEQYRVNAIEVIVSAEPIRDLEIIQYNTNKMEYQLACVIQDTCANLLFYNDKMARKHAYKKMILSSMKLDDYEKMVESFLEMVIVY